MAEYIEKSEIYRRYFNNDSNYCPNCGAKMDKDKEEF